MVEQTGDGAAIGTCTLGWSLASRSSGEARRLPDSLGAALGELVALAG